MAGLAAPGFFGKIPFRGDFVSGGLSDAFVSAWDAWLAPRINELEQRLGDRWLDVYLTSAILRFVMPRGVLGWPVTGILMPSVDRVGRYFPLTIASELPAACPGLATALRNGAWFDRLERIALDTLADDASSVAALSDALSEVPPDMPPNAATAGEGADALLGALAALAEGDRDDLALWWVENPLRFCLTAPLPRTDELIRLMAPARSDGPASERASGRTEIGHVRADNQDACLVDDRRGLYVVADGMGGHLDGARASRTLVESLAAVELVGTLAERAGAVAHCVSAVNVELYAHGRSNGDVCGATVVILLLAAGRFVVLWAGDSRVYRLGDGRAAQLTRDHVHADGSVTRACGAAATIELERIEGALAGDERFLLCSDGIYREVDVAALLTRTAALDPAALVDEAVAMVLGGAAADNLTVVVVEPG